MVSEEKYEIVERESENENGWGKVKGFFSRVGRKNLVIVCAVVLVGIAICLNWVLFAGDKDGGYDYNAGTENAGTNVSDGASTETAAYFASTQVSRDRARDEALAVLQNVVDNAETDSATKTQALEDIATIAANIEAESNIEALVMAKGFQQCIAIINDGACTIVVQSEGLLPNQMSQINEIVYEQTGIKPVNVKYIEKN